MMGTPDRTTAWINFAQRSRDEGGLGLAPHQAAGLVGNLVNESGQDLNPWGPSGDNGSAWGTAQWRGDRLARLQQRPDYRTMEGQQAFMRAEMDGPEAASYEALRAARTPEEAASAVNKYYERSADTSGHREQAAHDLMAQFGPDGSPGALTSSYAEGNKSMPALSADNTLGQGALNQAEPTANILGDAMQGIGASLAGISNPDQAKAITAQMVASQKTATDKGTWVIQTLPDGTSFYMNNKTRQTIPLGNHAKPEKDAFDEETKKLDAKAASDKYATTQDVASKADEEIEKLHQLRAAVQNPDVVFGGAGNAAATAKNIAYSLGIDVSGLTDTQAVQRISTQLQLAKGKLLPGAISNYEDKLMSLGNGFGLDKTREANLAAIDASEKLYNHQKSLAAEARKYKAAHGTLDDGWDTYRSQFAPPQDATPAAVAPAATPPRVNNTFQTKSGKTINWSF